MADTFISPIRMLLMVLAGILLAILVGCQSAKPTVALKATPPTTTHASPVNEPDSIAILWPTPSALAEKETPEPRILLADAHAAPKKPTPVVRHDHDEPKAAPVEAKPAIPDAHAPAKAPETAPAATVDGLSCPHCKHELSPVDLINLNVDADAKFHPADKALAKLLQGNQRYAAGKPLHPNQGTARRDEVAKGQAPFAIILGCADSRTSPEIVFDTGLGDVFPIRVAGNIAEDGGIASMEYAVEHLGTQLIVVLGHERCGAVKAACDVVEKKITLPGHLPTLTDAIKPAATSTQSGGGDWCDRAVIANAKLTAAKLRASGPILGHAVTSGKLKIVAARYDLDTGVVSVIDDAPAPAKPAMATTSEH